MNNPKPLVVPFDAYGIITIFPWATLSSAL